MHHIHLKKCHSTQDYLKEYLRENSKLDGQILVSTENQTQGIGRRGNQWLQEGNSLAFSFILSPNEVLTFSSIEVGIALINFLKINFKKKFYLKWPNDILDENGNKIAGIICQTSSNENMIIGVGINFKNSEENKYDYPSSFIDIELEKNDLKSLPKEFYQYISKNRYSAQYIKRNWSKIHYFHNEMVIIQDNSKSTKGKFIEIGDYGEAIIQEDQSLESLKLITGSLRKFI